MGKQYKTIISGLWRWFTTALHRSTMLQSQRKSHIETTSALSERKTIGKHQKCNDVDYHWIEVGKKTRSFPPNNMEKFIEHRLSGDYWIKEMGGGRIS